MEIGRPRGDGLAQRQVEQVDPRGFIAGIWHEIPPP
jgi:hypothetical protein